jgi:hypothetical protein
MNEEENCDQGDHAQDQIGQGGGLLGGDIGNDHIPYGRCGAADLRYARQPA